MAKEFPWNSAWTCVAGGSSGLGLCIAQQLAAQGANVAIIGRDRTKLDAAIASLRSHAKNLASQEFLSFEVDLTSKDSIANSQWARWLTTVQLSFACCAVGQSDRGFLMQLTAEELHQQWLTNVQSTLVFSQRVAPSLKANRGCLVHIASLAGISAPIGLGGYCITKHAVVGLSRQMRRELATDDVHVMLVCPGPISRSDQNVRYDDLIQSKQISPESMSQAMAQSIRQPGGGANLRSLDPIELSKGILSRAAARCPEWIVPGKVRILAALEPIWPRIADFLLAKSRKP